MGEVIVCLFVCLCAFSHGCGRAARGEGGGCIDVVPLLHLDSGGERD